MLQQVRVTSTGPAAIKPLLEAAICNQLPSLEYGIQGTQERSSEFEQRFQMPSSEFNEKFETGNLEESLDFIEWSGEIKTLSLIEDQLLSH